MRIKYNGDSGRKRSVKAAEQGGNTKFRIDIYKKDNHDALVKREYKSFDSKEEAKKYGQSIADGNTVEVMEVKVPELCADGTHPDGGWQLRGPIAEALEADAGDADAVGGQALQAELAIVVADGSAGGRYIHVGVLDRLACAGIANDGTNGIKLLLRKDHAGKC